MFFALKKHPIFFTGSLVGVAASVFASTLALFLPEGVISVSETFEWTGSSFLTLSVSVFVLIGINYAVSVYLFYRDRASAYALSFASAAAGLFILMKVASLFYF